MFCGYNTYDAVLRLKKFSSLSKFLAAAGRFLPLAPVLKSAGVRYLKYLYLYDNPAIINYGYLLSKSYLDGIIPDHPLKIEDKYTEIPEISGDIQQGHMVLDMLTYLPDDILKKMDGASMAVSLEARVPLLDHHVMQYALRIDHRLKYRNEKKYILKQLAHKYIPEQLLRRPKQGFEIPLNLWLKNDLHYLVRQYLNTEFIRKQGLFSDAVMQPIVNGFLQENKNGFFTRLVWNLVIFQLWADRYL